MARQSLRNNRAARREPKQAHQPPADTPLQVSGPLPADDVPDAAQGALPSPADGIPPHVWALLQSAGHEAAQKLLALLRSPTFSTFAPSSQARLIELALTRAYGLPVRRSVSVNLNSDDADAVAASLLDLADNLPERRAAARARDITPE